MFIHRIHNDDVIRRPSRPVALIGLLRLAPLVLALAAGAAPAGVLTLAGAGSGSAAALAPAGGGENHLQTSVPGVFTGANVGTLVGADRFYNAGIFGQGAITANVEAGHIWNGHETLGHVSVFQNAPGTLDSDGNPATPEYDRHATWVGMMIGGRPTSAATAGFQTGIAPLTDLRSGAVATAWGGTAYSLGFNFSANSFTQPYNAYFGQADVINSSWGFTDPESSSGYSIALDGLANQNPNTTFVVSAGNAGPGPNTVGSPGAGYNALTVGALANDAANNYDSVASFSSRGPQDYYDPINGTVVGVRAAVDIAAPGTDLTSAYYGGQTGGNNPTLTGSPNGPAGGPTFYTSGLGGTSFASPITAGAATLIDSASYTSATLAPNAASRDARVVKAVLMNSADKIPGWNNGQVANGNGLGGVITTQSLDWNSGAGALNLDRAFDQYLSGTTDVAGTGQGNLGQVQTVGWDYGQSVLGTDNIYRIDQRLLGGTNLYVTLDWFRDRLFDAQTLNFFDIAQANLDLLIRDTLSNQVISESISLYNVVEHLAFVLPRTSLYQIEVAFNGTTFGALDAVNYGLAWAGTAVPVPAVLWLMVAGLVLLRRRLA